MSKFIDKATIRNIKQSTACKQWEQIGINHKHGICTPLFSLYSQNSCGIGEYLDLIPFIQWCKNIGFNVIQLLPLNDTGEDSSPYNNISSVALNPIYLSLSSLPHIHQVADYKADLESLRNLNSLRSISYKDVRPGKYRFLSKYYNSICKKNIKNDYDFLNFQEQESYWLFPYTLFKAIKHHLKGAPINNWPKDSLDPKNFSVMQKLFSEKILFYSYIQYLCFQQLKSVKDYAIQNKILLKGDIPILISKDSADVWYYRHYFSDSLSVGCPPDLYNSAGQNWKLPLYNTKNIENDQYIWWINRLRYAENFYSIYRLDHVIGFYKMWVWDHHGNGKFIPISPKEYLPQGEKILKKFINSSSMLPLGEDLGAISDDIKLSLEKLGICGIRMPRWEKDWAGSNKFYSLNAYSPLSVTALSTHDSETVTSWWNQNPTEAKEFASFLNIPYTPKLPSSILKDLLKKSHNTSSLFHINMINDYLALCPDLVSNNLKHERINLPGIVSKNNWVYRCQLPIEDLFHHDSLSSQIQSILS